MKNGINEIKKPFNLSQDLRASQTLVQEFLLTSFHLFSKYIKYRLLVLLNHLLLFVFRPTNHEFLLDIVLQQ